MKVKITLNPIAPAKAPAVAGPTLEPVTSESLKRPAIDDLREAAPKIAAAASFELKLRRY